MYHYAYTPTYQRRSLQRPFRGLIVLGMTHLVASFPLRCFQRLSFRTATGQCHWHDNPNTSGSFTPVLSYQEQPLNHPTPTADRDRTVSTF